jgi:hypothetical protein
MCNRVRASFEFREVKVRWKLFNDLPEFRPSDNVVPDRDGKLAIIHNEQGNEGRLMYWALIPSFAEGMELPYSTINARDDHCSRGAPTAVCSTIAVALFRPPAFTRDRGEGRRRYRFLRTSNLRNRLPWQVFGIPGNSQTVRFCNPSQ